jgi:hypothetical protein
MATFIGFLLLLVLLYCIHRARRRRLHQQHGTRQQSDAPVRHVVRDSGTDDSQHAAGMDTPAEFLEADLSHQLLSGRIDPATYQLAMSQLAQWDETRSGDAR